jgi:hypothetical protein
MINLAVVGVKYLASIRPNNSTFPTRQKCRTVMSETSILECIDVLHVLGFEEERSSRGTCGTKYCQQIQKVIIATTYASLILISWQGFAARI